MECKNNGFHTSNLLLLFVMVENIRSDDEFVVYEKEIDRIYNTTKR